jgi:hypothetical protein
MQVSEMRAHAAALREENTPKHMALLGPSHSLLVAAILEATAEVCERLEGTMSGAPAKTPSRFVPMSGATAKEGKRAAR